MQLFNGRGGLGVVGARDRALQVAQVNQRGLQLFHLIASVALLHGNARDGRQHGHAHLFALGVDGLALVDQLLQLGADGAGLQQAVFALEVLYGLGRFGIEGAGDIAVIEAQLVQGLLQGGYVGARRAGGNAGVFQLGLPVGGQLLAAIVDGGDIDILGHGVAGEGALAVEVFQLRPIAGQFFNADRGPGGDGQQPLGAGAGALAQVHRVQRGGVKGVHLFAGRLAVFPADNGRHGRDGGLGGGGSLGVDGLAAVQQGQRFRVGHAGGLQAVLGLEALDGADRAAGALAVDLAGIIAQVGQRGLQAFHRRAGLAAGYAQPVHRGQDGHADGLAAAVGDLGFIQRALGGDIGIARIVQPVGGLKIGHGLRRALAVLAIGAAGQEACLNQRGLQFAHQLALVALAQGGIGAQPRAVWVIDKHFARQAHGGLGGVARLAVVLDDIVIAAVAGDIHGVARGHGIQRLARGGRAARDGQLARGKAHAGILRARRAQAQREEHCHRQQKSK